MGTFWDSIKDGLKTLIDALPDVEASKKVPPVGPIYGGKSIDDQIAYPFSDPYDYSRSDD